MIEVLLQLILLLVFWLIFLLGPIRMLPIAASRAAAHWDPKDRVKSYIEIPSRRLARLLIPSHRGYHSVVRTNIPALYNRYIVNQYPTRLSMLGVVSYCIGGALALIWGWSITGYFFWGHFDNILIPVSGIAMGVYSLMMGVAIDVNQARRDPPTVITKKEYKAWKGTQNK